MDTPGAAAALDFDLPCRNCGFNLRGLEPDRACPECGLPIDVSLREPLLRFAEPGWVRTLARGVTWLLVGVLVGLIAGVTSAVVAQHGPPLLAVLIAAVPQVPYLLGVWWFTTPEAGGLEGEDPASRSVARWSAVISVGLIGVSLSLFTAPVTASSAVDAINGVVALVTYFALFVYARRVALRIPDPELAKRTRTVMWGIVASYGVMILGGVVMAIAVYRNIGPAGGGGQPTASGGVFFVVAAVPLCSAGVALLVFGIWSLVLLFRYRSRLNLAADQAADAWTHRGPTAPE